MQQYEERLKRVNDYMEQSNVSFLKCQEELQSHRQKYAKEMQERDNALSLLIEKSIDLKSRVNSIDEKATNQFQNKKSSRKVGSSIADQIQELELSITSMMTMNDLSKCNDQNVIEVKNHLIDLYQCIAVKLLKKSNSYSEKLQKADKEWQETCDQLINELQTTKDELDRTQSETATKNRQLSDQLNELKTEHYQLDRQNQESTQKLKTELSNSINTHYLKNILSSYFSSNDSTVQLSLLKVVFNVMKFTDQEQLKVME